MTKNEAVAVITAIKILPVERSVGGSKNIRTISERQMQEFETMVNSLVEESVK